MALLVYLVLLIIPHLTGSIDDLTEDSSNSPQALFIRVQRSVAANNSVRVWNAMSDEFHALFVTMFDAVKKGTPETEKWLKAATDAGFVDGIDELRTMSDKKFFRVWWEMPDRKIAGFRMPMLMLQPGKAAAEAAALKVFYESNTVDESKGAFIMYNMGDVSDIIYMICVEDGTWRIDIPKEIPEGL